MGKRQILVICCCAIFILITGCSVSEKSLTNVENRIAALKSKGVPDTLLTKSKVFLYQAREAKKKDIKKVASMAADSMKYYIKKAEKEYKDAATRVKPWLEQQQSAIAGQLTQLKGLNKSQVDSLLLIVDSLVKKDWLLQAEDVMKQINNAMPRFIANQKLGEELRAQVTGVWTCTNVTKNVEDKTVNAVEKKVFNFNNDGTIKLVENKKGKSTPLLKEDWEFESDGKWDIKGDTFFLFINRFKAKKQDFWELKQEAGKTKKDWIKKTHPTYDSAIVDHSQDRFIIWKDLQTDFKKG